MPSLLALCVLALAALFGNCDLGVVGRNTTLQDAHVHAACIGDSNAANGSLVSKPDIGAESVRRPRAQNLCSAPGAPRPPPVNTRAPPPAALRT